MRVLHIGLYDRVGGACIAAYRQHQALKQAGVDSRMWVRFKVTNDPTVTAFQSSLQFRPRLTRLLRRYLYKYQLSRAGLKGQMFDARSEHGADMLAGMPEADVINIHFGWGFIDYPSFFTKEKNKTPLVITMHEMANFTGGCSHAEECIRFQNECGNCPQIEKNFLNDITRKGYKLRKKCLDGLDPKKIIFVANSRWTEKTARRSSLLQNFNIQKINLGIDGSIFKPIDQMAARSFLNIDKDKKVLGFAAAGMGDRRKGLDYLYKALDEFKEKPLLLTWGRNHPKDSGKIPHLHLGHIENESLIALAYNALDIFVMPSLVESFGQTAAESISCGVPVVAFSVGGIPEIVRDGETGILAPVGDVRALKEALEKMLNDKSLRENFGRRGVEVARQEFSFQKNADSYVKLYQGMLERGG